MEKLNKTLIRVLLSGNFPLPFIRSHKMCLKAPEKFPVIRMRHLETPEQSPTNLHDAASHKENHLETTSDPLDTHLNRKPSTH